MKKKLMQCYNRWYKLITMLITGTEKVGYGFSDISDIDRDIDTILFETRESLIRGKNKQHKVILVLCCLFLL